MIKFKEAVSKIWQTVKKIKRSEEPQIVDIFCDSLEDIPVFIDAINSGHIASLLESRNIEINLHVPSHQISKTGVELLQVALASSALELSCLSNYSTTHWLRRLMTFAYHTCSAEDEELKNSWISCFPVALLPEDELADELYTRAIAQEEITEKRLEELMKVPDTATEVQKEIQAIKSLEGTITTTLDCATAFTLVGMLQLAFRHPAVKEFNPNGARFFTQGLIDQLAEKSPAVKTYLEKGWHPEYDQ
jgi:hypothetical protein